MSVINAESIAAGYPIAAWASSIGTCDYLDISTILDNNQKNRYAYFKSWSISDNRGWILMFYIGEERHPVLITDRNNAVDAVKICIENGIIYNM
jgi:hypothetical protein